MVRVNDITQIPARDDAGHRQVFHHYLPDRRSQTRGVTAFAPMADTADHWDDLGILAVNLDLPLCVFLLDASETNYSGFRGAIDQARQRWREIQSWMMGSFHRPVYEWKVRQWAVTDSALRKAVERADELRASLAAAARWCRHALRRRPRLTASNGWKAAVRSVGNGISRIRIPWCGILSLPEETVHFQAVPHGATEADACSQIGLRFR